MGQDQFTQQDPTEQHAAPGSGRRGEVRHVDELFGAPVDLEFVLHDRSEVFDAVTAAGLVDVEWYLRSPLRDVETPTDRLYVVARRPH